MKILYVITRPDLGGAQVHLYELVSHCRQHGIQPYVVVGTDGWLSEQLRILGVLVIVVPKLVREISFKKDLQAIYRLSGIIGEIHPDLVHCHSSKAGILGRIAAWINHVPVVFTAHGWAFTEGVHPVKRFVYGCIERVIAHITAKIICVSEYDRQLGLCYMGNQGHKLVTVYNGISSQETSATAERIFGETLQFIMVARFSAPKEHIQVLRALQIVKSRGKSIRVTFVGDGPDYNQVKHTARAFQVDDMVVFEGQSDHVRRLLPQYDVFLLISRWEGFPISILEAMSAGLPVMASNVGGVKEEVVDGSTGWLIPNGDYKYLADRMIDVIDHRERLQQLGENGKKMFEENFTVVKMLDKIWRIYDECLGRI